MLDLDALFKKYNKEYLKFERVEKKLSNRPDLHAFILLDRLMPGETEMVSAAEHEEIFLSVEPSDFAEIATEEDLLELIRCGIRYSEDSFALFV